MYPMRYPFYIYVAVADPRGVEAHNTQNPLSIKPAKLNIAEFEGLDADSWIQNIEQYFSASRTPNEQRTEIAISYLKGEAIQWWRGTGFLVSNTPWHKFCSALTQRFAVTSTQLHFWSESIHPKPPGVLGTC